MAHLIKVGLCVLQPLGEGGEVFNLSHFIDFEVVILGDDVVLGIRHIWPGGSIIVVEEGSVSQISIAKSYR